jgi:SAM-dependent methyltransferase
MNNCLNNKTICLNEDLNLISNYTKLTSNLHKDIYERILSEVINNLKETADKYGEALTNGRELLTVNVWDLGSGLIEWENINGFKEINKINGIKINWYRIDKIYQEEKSITNNNVTFKYIRCEIEIKNIDEFFKYYKEKCQNIYCYPDIIIAKHFFSRLESEQEQIKKGIRTFYGYLNPGGVFIIADVKSDFVDINDTDKEEKINSICSSDDEISKNRLLFYWKKGLELAKINKINECIKDIFENLGSLVSLNDQRNFIFTCKKEDTIFEKEVTSRANLLDENLRGSFIKEIMESLIDYPENSKVLDVGVGDGRFSKFIIKECELKQWQYKGVELKSPEKIEGLPGNIKNKGIIFNQNYFKIDPQEKFDIIFLLFMLHIFTHWHLAIKYAHELLNPGGTLVLGFRYDLFSMWRHDIFIDNFDSKIKEILKNYWRMRNERGWFLSPKLLNNLYNKEPIDFAIKNGFQLHNIVLKSNILKYYFKYEDLEPSRRKWSFACLGYTPYDSEILKSIENLNICEELEQVIVGIILKKFS